MLMRVVCFAAAVLILSACGVRHGLEKESAAFEKEFAQYLQETGTIGAAVVFVADDQIAYHQNFGLKNIERQVPLGDGDLFRIASISKSFTACSILQLVEKGVISLDTDVSDLAGFPIRNPRYPDKAITVEMLLSHTSSINDSQDYLKWQVINPRSNPDYALCYNDYEPGKGYEYCNLNFNLLGVFLERLSGERFDQYVVRQVIRPLGLSAGYCVDSLQRERFVSLYEYEDGERVCQDAWAYEPRSEKIRAYRMGQDALLFSPTGGLKISSLDLARYMVMHMNYGYSPLAGVRIIPEALSRQMQTPRSDEEHYGLALWHSDIVEGVDLVGHTGSAYGLLSCMFFNPEEHYGFVVITNGTDDEERFLSDAVRMMHRHFVASVD